MPVNGSIDVHLIRNVYLRRIPFLESQCGAGDRAVYRHAARAFPGDIDVLIGYLKIVLSDFPRSVEDKRNA